MTGQGGQIMDNALCGGGSAQLSGAAATMVKAAIFMGDPRYVSGLSYNVGTCKAKGVSKPCMNHSFISTSRLIYEMLQFAARPSGFQCSAAAKIKSYCDAADPYCCNGSSQATHQGYGGVYGQQALAFIKTKITA